jgi:hypothetical protein
MSYTLISTQTVGAGGAASISFTSIPQIYTDLYLVVSGRSDSSQAAPAVHVDMHLTVNGSTTGYSERMLYGRAGSAASANSSGSAFFNWAGTVDGSTATSTTFSTVGIYIPNYAGSTNKVFISENATENNASEGIIESWTGLWTNTAAITSLSATLGNGNFVQYSTASLYGVNPIPTASLGTTPTVDYLVVAGGGSGSGFNLGINWGQGGNGGYVTSGTGLSVPSGTPITVTVGAGGSGVGNVTNGTAGSASAFGATTASGATAVTYPTGTSVGGYGAGNINAPSPTATSYGGVGVSSSINGINMAVAGGGSMGNAIFSSKPAIEGSSFGGGGAEQAVGVWAVPKPNTGGGGYGAISNGATSGSGQSGVVAIRYPQTYNPPTAVTGNPAVNYVNGYRVYTWYASGSITF